MNMVIHPHNVETGAMTFLVLKVKWRAREVRNVKLMSVGLGEVQLNGREPAWPAPGPGFSHTVEEATQISKWQK